METYKPLEPKKFSCLRWKWTSVVGVLILLAGFVTLIYFVFIQGKSPSSAASVVIPNPEQIAYRVADSVFLPSNQDTFFNHNEKWYYGSALSTIALFEVLDTFTANATYANYILNNISTIMDSYYEVNREAYNVTNDIIMPFGVSIGDYLGLYPLCYLIRYDYLSRTGKGGTPDSRDLIVANKSAELYIMDWPTHTPEGTICRTSCGSWGVDGYCLWGDDIYMGLTLMTRLASYYRNQTSLEWVLDQKMKFVSYLKDPVSNLYAHAYNINSSIQSCCKWSRSNGWILMSHVEALLALETFLPSNQNLYNTFLGYYRDHASGLKAVQDSTTGLWHQVLTEKDIWLETSSSSMILWSLALGITHHWITDSDYGHVVDRAWIGVASQVESNGTVDGICEGCSVQLNVTGYATRSTAYAKSYPALGSVFRAAAGYGQLLQWRQMSSSGSLSLPPWLVLVFLFILNWISN